MTVRATSLPGRRPPASPELATRLEGRLSAADGEGGPAAESLAGAGLGALDEARRGPGRVRESAYRLLEADALLTHACLAALDRPDAELFLQRLVSQAASDDR
jgi:hypothetical protein